MPRTKGHKPRKVAKSFKVDPEALRLTNDRLEKDKTLPPEIDSAAAVLNRGLWEFGKKVWNPK